MRVCFFVKTNDIAIFSKVEFYKNDVDILTSLGYSVDCCNRISDLLKKKYDLYFVWWFGYGVIPSLLAYLFRKPCIVIGNIHRLSGEGLSSWPFRKRILMKLCMKLASISLFTSTTEIKRLGNFRPKKIDLLYNCVKYNVYYPDENVKKKSVILCISNLTKENVERKMILESLTAFSFFLKKNSGFIFVLCGTEGDGLSSVISHVESLNIAEKFIYLGRVSVEEKINLLRSSLLYIQPTLAEGFGVAILEAQSCGTLVITTFEPCINEIFSNTVVQATDIYDLSLKMELLSNNRILYDKYVKLGFENSLKYSFEKRRANIKLLFESLN